MSATVTGTFKNGSGTAIVAELVEFVLVNRPVVQSSGVIIVGLAEDYKPTENKPRVKATTGSSGDISVTLEAGTYDVYMFGVKLFTITAPSSGTSTIDGLVVSNIAEVTTQYFRVKNGRAQFLNEDTSLWHTAVLYTVGGVVSITLDQTGES